MSCSAAVLACLAYFLCSAGPSETAATTTSNTSRVTSTDGLWEPPTWSSNGTAIDLDQRRAGNRRKRSAFTRWIKPAGTAFMATVPKTFRRKVAFKVDPFQKKDAMIKVIESIKIFPKMIVFDLDRTLWPFKINTHVLPPFTREPNGEIIDQRGIRVTPFFDVAKILELLTFKNIGVSIAAKTKHVQPSNHLIELFDWDFYIKNRQIYPGSKQEHLTKIRDDTKLKFHEMIHFDDQRKNLDELRELGVFNVLASNGMTMGLLVESLRQYNEFMGF